MQAEIDVVTVGSYPNKLLLRFGHICASAQDAIKVLKADGFTVSGTPEPCVWLATRGTERRAVLEPVIPASVTEYLAGSSGEIVLSSDEQQLLLRRIEILKARWRQEFFGRKDVLESLRYYQDVRNEEEEVRSGTLRSREAKSSIAIWVGFLDHPNTPPGLEAPALSESERVCARRLAGRITTPMAV